MTVGTLIKSLAFVAGLFVFDTSCMAKADDCAPDKLNLVKTVSVVYDAGSFLIDNDYVVLTGVHVPSTGRTNTKEESGGKYAAQLVGQWMDEVHGKVGLELDQLTAEDGHVLTHLYLPNGKNLAEQLLEQGLALVDTKLPNTKHFQCYRDAETRARAGKKGLWQYQDRGVPVVDSRNLTGDRDGFQVVRGKIVLAKEGKGHFILNMDTLGIRIANDLLSSFVISDLNSLVGKTIEVRGNLRFFQGNMFVNIHHPGQIDLLADKLKNSPKLSNK